MTNTCEDELISALVDYGVSVKSLEVKREDPRGLKTTVGVEKDSIILTIPVDLTISSKSALSHLVLSKFVEGIKDDDDQLLALMLMYLSVTAEKLLEDGTTSKIERINALHVKSMPKSYTNSIYVTDLDLETCRGSSIYHVTERLKAQVEGDFKALQEKVLNKYTSELDNSKFTLDLYKWALCSVWSRGMDFPLTEDKYYRVLVPFMDLVNGSLTVDQCHCWDPVNKNIVLLAGQEYKAGDEVFLHYGAVSNSHYSRLYGFVFDENENNGYDLYLSTSDTCVGFDKKMTLFHMLGFQKDMVFKLKNDDLIPQPLLQYLIIQRTDSIEDLDRMITELTEKQTMSITEEGLTLVLKTLLNALEAIIEEFENVNMLKLHLSRMGKNSAAYNCVHAALSELTILQMAVKKLEQQLQ